MAYYKLTIIDITQLFFFAKYLLWTIKLLGRWYVLNEKVGWY